MATEARNEERLESPEVHTGYVLLWAIASLTILAISIALLGAVYHWRVRVQSFPAPQHFPAPGVQAGQRTQLRALQTQQLDRLNRYQWVDRKNGLIQIPIERAMHILAGEGMQAYAPLAPAQALSPPSAGAERLETPQAAAPSGAAPAPAGGKP